MPTETRSRSPRPGTVHELDVARARRFPSGSTSTVPQRRLVHRGQRLHGRRELRRAAGGQIFAFAEHFTQLVERGADDAEPVERLRAYGAERRLVHRRNVRGGRRGRSRAAAAQQPLAELLNGSTWKYQPLPSPGYQDPFGNALEGVSCTASNACTAGGVTGGKFDDRIPVQRLLGDAGHAGPRLDLAVAGFTAVSCGAATACTAVGTFGAEGWTPAGGWVSETLAPPPNLDLVGVAERWPASHAQAPRAARPPECTRSLRPSSRPRSSAGLRRSEASVRRESLADVRLGWARRAVHAVSLPAWRRRYRAHPAPARRALLLAFSRARRSPSASPSRRSARSRTRSL